VLCGSDGRSRGKKKKREGERGRVFTLPGPFKEKAICGSRSRRGGKGNRDCLRKGGKNPSGSPALKKGPPASLTLLSSN